MFTTLSWPFFIANLNGVQPDSHFNVAIAFRGSSYVSDNSLTISTCPFMAAACIGVHLFNDLVDSFGNPLANGIKVLTTSIWPFLEAIKIGVRPMKSDRLG